MVRPHIWIATEIVPTKLIEQLGGSKCCFIITSTWEKKKQHGQKHSRNRLLRPPGTCSLDLSWWCFLHSQPDPTLLLQLEVRRNSYHSFENRNAIEVVPRLFWYTSQHLVLVATHLIPTPPARRPLPSREDRDLTRRKWDKEGLLFWLCKSWIQVMFHVFVAHDYCLVGLFNLWRRPRAFIFQKSIMYIAKFCKKNQ